MTLIAQWQTTDISTVNEYFVCIDFHTAQICVFLYISLQCCYHNDLATVATFSFLRAGGN